MADRRYYPYVPWDDDPVSGVVIDHNTIHADSIDHNTVHSSIIPRDGIYGPEPGPGTFVVLVAADLLKLVTRDHKVIGTAA